VEFTLENKKYPKKIVEKNRQNLWGGGGIKPLQQQVDDTIE
jgi:hypothetical protein